MAPIVPPPPPYPFMTESQKLGVDNACIGR
jgi:hypothetical protein